MLENTGSLMAGAALHSLLSRHTYRASLCSGHVGFFASIFGSGFRPFVKLIPSRKKTAATVVSKLGIGSHRVSQRQNARLQHQRLRAYGLLAGKIHFERRGPIIQGAWFQGSGVLDHFSCSIDSCRALPSNPNAPRDRRQLAPGKHWRWGLILEVGPHSGSPRSNDLN